MRKLLEPPFDAALESEAFGFQTLSPFLGALGFYFVGEVKSIYNYSWLVYLHNLGASWYLK